MANKYLEIAKLVESPDNIRKDMGDALELAREHFKNKYLKRVIKAVEYERMKTMANPPREVALIAALKEFVPPERHEMYERMTDAMITLSSWQEIRKNMNYASVNPQRTPFFAQGLAADYTGFEADDSLHHDGVYDVDPECRPHSMYNGSRLTEMMFLLSLLNK